MTILDTELLRAIYCICVVLSLFHQLPQRKCCPLKHVPSITKITISVQHIHIGIFYLDWNKPPKIIILF